MHILRYTITICIFLFECKNIGTTDSTGKGQIGSHVQVVLLDRKTVTDRVCIDSLCMVEIEMT